MARTSRAPYLKKYGNKKYGQPINPKNIWFEVTVCRPLDLESTPVFTQKNLENYLSSIFLENTVFSENGQESGSS